MEYLRRHADARLAHLLSIHPALVIEGIRGVGKTSTGARRRLILSGSSRAAVTADIDAAFAAADHFETAAELAGDRRRQGVLLARRYSSNSYSLACAARWRNAEYFG